MQEKSVIFLNSGQNKKYKRKERPKTAIRTDLAIETAEIHGNNLPDSLINKEKKQGNVNITRIKIKNKAEETAFGRPQGDYVTLEFPDISVAEPENLKELIRDELNALLPEKRGLILVAGLGNRDITPDALGPAAAKRIFATRHIPPALSKTAGLENLRQVAVIAPGVLGQTGIEAGELIKAAADRIKPDAVIVIDALAAKSPERLFKTVQLCNTGISPGSGVKNSRKEISEKTVGVPVIAVGVPTVIDTDTLIEELTGVSPAEKSGMFVTPKEVDMLIVRLSEILAEAINMFLQPETDPEIISELV